MFEYRKGISLVSCRGVGGVEHIVGGGMLFQSRIQLEASWYLVMGIFFHCMYSLTPF